MPDPVIHIRDLIKSYGPRRAVDNISFDVPSGCCLGLLGPNGAGKTTAISMIGGLIAPDSGTVSIQGRQIQSDTDPLKRAVGLVPQDLALYDELTASQNLRFFGALYQLHGQPLRDAIARSLELVGLHDRAEDRVRTFSGGMKRRLNIAASLLHDPTIVLLDEPTVGVDPQSRNAIFSNIESLRRSGKTILYTTHYMEEVERLCDRVVIMDHGRIIAHDTLSGLKSKTATNTRLVLDLETPPNPVLIQALTSVLGVSGVEVVGTQVRLGLQALDASAERILATLRAHGATCTHLNSERPNLESVFLELTGRTLRDA